MFAEIFKQDRPLLDVRAPVEFIRGAFPTAKNLPILNDEERARVGSCYKLQGQQAATALGHELVKKVKQERIDSWLAFLEQNPGALLYCFRGGQRSSIAKQWLAAQGVNIEKIPGGYKAMRQFLMSSLEALPPILIIAGRTGVGKTQALEHYQSAVDLEAIANHRGSAFGKQLSPQPGQIDFENRLAIAILKQKGPIILEDESRLIGRLNLPLPLQNAMKNARLVLLEDSLENRTERIFQEYILEQTQTYAACQTDSISSLKTDFLDSLFRIKKRLGGDRYKVIAKIMADAFDAQALGNPNQHKNWIEILLKNYYDPMYEYQLTNKQTRIASQISWQDLPSEDELHRLL